MRFLGRNRPENPNFLVGLFLLILMAVFLGPNVLPRLVATISPTIDTAPPCDWLHRATDSANHQSLIGRAADNALSLTVRTGPIPTDPSAYWEVDIVISNTSLGTVPFVYNANQINIGDNQTTGLGLAFTPNTYQALNAGRVNAVSYAEQDIRLLGPRQQCTHTVLLPVSQLDANIRAGASQVYAYYRINTAGQVIQPANTIATPIYYDQGLDVVSTGFIESAPVQVMIQAQSQ